MGDRPLRPVPRIQNDRRRSVTDPSGLDDQTAARRLDAFAHNTAGTAAISIAAVPPATPKAPVVIVVAPVGRAADADFNAGWARAEIHLTHGGSGERQRRQSDQCE